MSLKKSEEFKREAVQLSLTSGLSCKQVHSFFGNDDILFLSLKETCQPLGED